MGLEAADIEPEKPIKRCVMCNKVNWRFSSSREGRNYFTCQTLDCTGEEITHD